MALARGIRPLNSQVFMCDFGPDPDEITGDGVTKGPLAVKPEIWKERQVVIVNSTNGTAIVVPFSTEEPDPIRRFHVRIPAGTYGWSRKAEDSWAKCDLIEAVSFDRLYLPLVGGRPSKEFLSKPHFYEIRVAVLNAIALGALAPHLIDPTPKPKIEAPADIAADGQTAK